MKRILVVLLLAVAVVACGSQQNKKVENPRLVEPKQYGLKIKATYPHLESSYTQGLQYVDGLLWEGTGEWGESVLQKVDLQSGEATVLARLPRSEFGEGITVLGDRVYQLTWTNNTAHVYDLEGNKIKDIRYPGEGWGLTSDGEKLYMSDGSERIYQLNPETFKRERTMIVTIKGEPVQFVNELEWIEGKIWANVYTTDYVVIIDPATGVVEGVVDCSGLLKEADKKEDTDVLNGIAYDAQGKRIFLTGKRWNKLFEIELIEK